MNAEPLQSVRMIRPNLENFPSCLLPAGFTLRWYQPGDEEQWLRIHLLADKHNAITPQLFEKQFNPRAALGDRQCYLLGPAGEVCGTVTAWFNDNFQGARWGRVHWLAVLPDFQGRALGKALMSAACHRLRELGHERAYLSTSTGRPAAIALYWQFGFRPFIENSQDRVVWTELLEKTEFIRRNPA